MPLLPCNVDLSKKIICYSCKVSTVSKNKVKELTALLSPQENAKSQQLRQCIDRTRFIISKAMTRLLLSEILDLPPTQLSFTTSQHGKPQIVNANNIYFNLSHSGDYVVLAINAHAELGIDIECCNRNINILAIAERFFCRSEYQLLAELDKASRATAFFQIWTAKEAVVKALGSGLTFGLNNFCLDISNSEQPIITSMQEHPAADFNLYQWKLDSHHIATICLHSKKLLPVVHKEMW